MGLFTFEIPSQNITAPEVPFSLVEPSAPVHNATKATAAIIELDSDIPADFFEAMNEISKGNLIDMDEVMEG